MADVEPLVGNLTKVDIAEDETTSTDSTKTTMQLPVSLNLSAPVARDWVRKRREHLKPWLEFLATSKFQSPGSLPRLSSRLIRNIDHFQSNYLCIFIILIFYCLLTSPLLLIAVAASLAACNFLSKRNVEKKIIIAGQELSLAQQYGLVSLCSFPLFYLAGAGAIVFWVLGASLFLIVLHATFYNNDPLEDAFEQPIQQV